MVTTMRRLHFWGFIAGGLLLVPGFNSAAGARQSLQEKQIIAKVLLPMSAEKTFAARR